MPIPTFQPSVAPAPGFTRNKSPQVKNNPFGDNYFLKITQSINSNLMTGLDLAFNLLQGDWAEALQLEEFMDSLNGTAPFYYQLAPDVAPRTWICGKYAAVPLKGGLANFTGTFDEQPSQ